MKFCYSLFKLPISLAHSLAAAAIKCQYITSQISRNLGARDAVVWHAVVIFIIVTSLRTLLPVTTGWKTKWAEVQRRQKEHYKAQTVELSSQCKLPASVCSGLNTVAAYTCTSNPGMSVSRQVYYCVAEVLSWRSLSVYFTVITHAYYALSKHAHSCSGIKCKNLVAPKTLKTPSVSSPEPMHWLCTIYKHKRRKAKPYSLGSKKPPFWFSTVLTKNRGFWFRYGFRHSTITKRYMQGADIKIK